MRKRVHTLFKIKIYWNFGFFLTWECEKCIYQQYQWYKEGNVIIQKYVEDIYIFVFLHKFSKIRILHDLSIQKLHYTWYWRKGYLTSIL